MSPDTKIYIAGHDGMVGSAIFRELKKSGFHNLILRSRSELDLTQQNDANYFFEKNKPEYVFLAAAKVGGLMANKSYPADFITTNLQIQTNVINSAFKHGVKKLLFVASSCIYPRECRQPMKEEHLWSGYLEPTNAPFAVAKLAGIEMCRAYHDQYGSNFFSVVLCNLFGINDNYHPENSHIMAALIIKAHHAKMNKSPAITLWGTGTPRRELMNVDDAAKACIHIMQHYTAATPINIGPGRDLSIREIAEAVCNVIGYRGNIEFDATKPDGMSRKLLDSTQASTLGWRKSETSLFDDIKVAYADYLQQHF